MNSQLNPDELKIQFPETLDTEVKLECIRILNLQWKEIERLENELIKKEADLGHLEDKLTNILNRLENFGLRERNNGDLYVYHNDLFQSQTQLDEKLKTFCHMDIDNVQFITSEYPNKIFIPNENHQPSICQKIQKLAYQILHPNSKG